LPTIRVTEWRLTSLRALIKRIRSLYQTTARGKQLLRKVGSKRNIGMLETFFSNYCLFFDFNKVTNWR